MTTFPTSIDDWQNPTGSDALSTSPDGRTHSEQHGDLNDVALSVEGMTVGTPFVSSAGYTDHAAVVLNTAESLTVGGTWGVANAHSGDTPSLDAVNFTTGSNSVTCDIMLGTSGATYGALYVDLPAPVTVAPYRTLSMDIRFHLGSVGGTSASTWSIWAADGVGLTGNLVEIDITAGSELEDLWLTRTGTISSLTTIRSVGLKRGSSSSSTKWCTWWIDNIELQSATAIDDALTQNATGAVIVPADYVPSVQQIGFNTIRQVLDLRTDHGNLTGAGGVYNLRDWRVDETGTEDVTTEVQAILDWLPDGATLKAPSTGLFRVDSNLAFGSNADDTPKRHVTFDGQGSRWYQPTEVNKQFFGLSGMNNTLRGFRAFSLNALETDDVSGWAAGDAQHPIVGSPTVVGTTIQLNGLNEQIELPWRGTDEVAYYARDHLGVNHWEFVLSDSDHITNDCKFTVMEPDGTVLQTTTQTLTGTPTTYEVTYTPTNLYLPLRVAVSKATATANTITVTSSVQYGRQRYLATLAFNHFVAMFGDNCSVFDSWCEGIGGDLVTTQGDHSGSLVQNCTSRVNGRMGMSVSKGTNVTWKDCEVLGSGQWSHDFEPDSINSWMSDITIDNCRFIDPSLGFMAATSTMHIRRVHIRNCEYIRTSARGGLWCDGGWWEGDVTNCIFMRNAAGPHSPLHFRGRGVNFSNITSSGGIEFDGGTKSDENGLVLAQDFNHVDGWRAYDPDVLTATAGANDTFSNCVSLNGSYRQSYP